MNQGRNERTRWSTQFEILRPIASTTLTPKDEVVYAVPNAVADVTLTLPPAGMCADRLFLIKSNGNDTYDIVVNSPEASPVFTTSLTGDGEFVVLFSDGSAWYELDNANSTSQRGQIKKLRIVASAAGAETDSGWTIPTGAVVRDVIANVITAEATGGTKTLDIGTNGTSNDPDGFADALSVAATGLVRPQATITAGSNESYFSATTRGALLAEFTAGDDVVGDTGTNYESPCITAGGDNLTTTDGSNDFVELVMDLYVMYDVLV